MNEKHDTYYNEQLKTFEQFKTRMEHVHLNHDHILHLDLKYLLYEDGLDSLIIKISLPVRLLCTYTCLCQGRDPVCSFYSEGVTHPSAVLGSQWSKRQRP